MVYGKSVNDPLFKSSLYPDGVGECLDSNIFDFLLSFGLNLLMNGTTIKHELKLGLSIYD